MAPAVGRTRLRTSQAPAGATEKDFAIPFSFPQIQEQSLFEIRFESWLTVLRAENNVRQEIGVCVCHRCYSPPGLVEYLVLPAPRLAPWATF